MSDPLTKPKSSKRRWIRIVVGTVLLGAVALAWFEGPLWSEIHYAADETFAGEEGWANQLLRVDTGKNLARYSPRRVARYLYVPSERWQAVACLALRGDRDRDAAQWERVPPLLVRTAVAARNPGLRQLCLQAFNTAPSYSDSDVESVLKTLSTSEIPELDSFVQRLAARAPKGSPALKETLPSWLTGGSPARRNVAFQVAVESFDDLDDASAAQVRPIFGKGEDVAKPWRVLHVLLDRKPNVGQSLLGGPPADRAIFWKAMGTRIEGQAAESPLLAAADAAALKQLANPEERALVIDYLLNRPKGLNLLFRGLQSQDDACITAIFEKLPAAGVVTFRPRYEPLGAEGAEAFVAVLPRLRGEARKRWGDWMHIVGRAELADALFPRGVGPRDPRHAASFASLLDSDQEALWVSSYFDTVAALPKEKVESLVKRLRVALQTFGAPPPPPRLGAAAAAMGMGGGRPAPQTATTAHFRLAAALKKHHPDHPQVVAFFRDLPRVEQELARQAAPARGQRAVNRG